jgi:hypothetical protein
MTFIVRRKLAAVIAIVMAAGGLAGCRHHPGNNSDFHGHRYHPHHSHDHDNGGL